MVIRFGGRVLFLDVYLRSSLRRRFRERFLQSNSIMEPSRTERFSRKPGESR